MPELISQPADSLQQPETPTALGGREKDTQRYIDKGHDPGQTGQQNEKQRP